MAERASIQADLGGERTSLIRTRASPIAPLIALLAAARQAQGITQRDLADRIGVTDDLVSRWESGVRQPRLDNLVAWVAALGGVVAIVAAPEARGGRKPAPPPPLHSHGYFCPSEVDS
jgi:transcriptional regulator with XRE-family HTH domain